jgi:hypothetical protein
MRTLSIEPIVVGTDRSTTRRMPAKSYLSGTLNRDRGGGAGGGAATSAISLATLAAAVDLPAHPVHKATLATAQSAGVRVRDKGYRSCELMR